MRRFLNAGQRALPRAALTTIGYRSTAGLSSRRALHSSPHRLYAVAKQTAAPASTSSVKSTPSARPLDSPRWATKRAQIMEEWSISEDKLEKIVVMASSKTNRDEEIMHLLKQSPLPPGDAANRLAWSMPNPLSRSRSHQEIFNFQPSKERLLHIAWKHASGDHRHRAALVLAAKLAHQPEGRSEAMRIADKMIEEGYAEAFATKALCYQLEWDRTVDAAKKKILASQIQQSLRQGIKRHDPWSAYILADLWWLGRVLRKDPEKAKELWLQATEWDTRKPNKGLDKFANAVVPRFVRAPWKANPDADAQMCLKYTLETDGVVPRSNCRLGLFYYLRPDMSREEHVRVWTTEPDNTKAAELFIKAINGRFFQAKVFLAEMLLWNRVTVLQTADGLAVQHARSSGEAAGMDGSGEADSQSLPSNTTSTTPATSLESSAESDDDGKTASSPRREQLTLVRTLLSDLVRWPREYVTAQRLDRLAERLLKNVDSGSGDVLPTERDLRFLRSRDRASPSPVKAAKRTEGPVEPKPVTKEVEHVELALA